MTRHEHWDTQHFHEFLTERAHAPFAWGENDCALFAADAIQSFTGVDIAEDFRGKYTDEASALETIKEITGGETVADAAAWCAAKHELPELANPLFAQRGDLVILDAPSGHQIAGIVGLNGHAISVYDKGLFRLPITSVVRAWRV
jgi:hypothetical protein